MDTATNATMSNPRLHWVAEPKFRGTFGIFSLCLSTMIISVWSAVHFDIPTHRPSKLRSFVKSVLWMLEALFCPELLLFIAFNQRANAAGVTECAQRLLPLRPQKDDPSFLVKAFRSCFWRSKLPKVESYRFRRFDTDRDLAGSRRHW